MIKFNHEAIRIIEDGIESNLSTLINKSQLVKAIESNLNEKRDLIFLEGSNSKEFCAIFAYLLNQEIPFAIIPNGLSLEQLQNLIDAYKPRILITNFENYHEGIKIYSKKRLSAFLLSGVKKNIHNNLALLLFTSGTTGSPQACKLSYLNIESSASMISESLFLDESDLAITTLQPSYIYGLSIIFSHFFVGAGIILNSEPIYSRNFWNLVNINPGINFGAVPTQYQMLRDVYKNNLDFSGVKFITQAGGGLSPELIDFIKKKCLLSNSKFYIMYGQTEASPRISCNCITDKNSKINSVGKVLRGGQVNIIHEKNELCGELIYKGKNIFMGYANNWLDLEFDKTPDYLSTGDLATIDEEGYIYLKGRIKRIAKINSLRINLDYLESALQNHLGISAIVQKEENKLDIFVTNKVTEDQITLVSKFLKINKNNLRFTLLNKIPLGLNDKINYRELNKFIN